MICAFALFGTIFAHVMSMRGKTIDRASAFLSLAVASAAVMAALLFSGCGGQTSGNVTSAGIGPANAAPAALTQESLRELVVRDFGDASLVRNATLSADGVKQNVAVEVNRPAGVSNASIEGVMAAFTGKLMADLFEHGEVAGVSITMYGVDAAATGEGTASSGGGDAVAIKAVMDRVTANETDWTMFGPMTMSSMLTEYYINPAVLR